MRIPVRAAYRRPDKPGGEYTLIQEDYAEIPDALVAGEMALAGADIAHARGDEDGARRIEDAVERACADGKLMTR